MNAIFDIRPTHATERSALMDMYGLAFPDEDLRDVVASLLDEPRGVISLTGFDEGEVVAHVIFADIFTNADRPKGALLGPLAVRPSHQKKGWGRAMVAAGEGFVAGAGGVCVCVLGDPAYYGRLGYRRERNLLPPYPLPDGWAGAWQSRALGSEAMTPGVIRVLASWRDPVYWTP